eukprot:TRINITY_DN12669_c0_g1_i1.p1 TRINITY_DN12669_c0_g1~~TRINITY_DN12669_c0_g1_i1.p1  ORF type:complete len:545 (+),score=62.25 TRINITY_DN12669_c0_g1_i1:729-2363(+)
MAISRPDVSLDYSRDFQLVDYVMQDFWIPRYGESIVRCTCTILSTFQYGISECEAKDILFSRLTGQMMKVNWSSYFSRLFSSFMEYRSGRYTLRCERLRMAFQQWLRKDSSFNADFHFLIEHSISQTHKLVQECDILSLADIVSVLAEIRDYERLFKMLQNVDVICMLYGSAFQGRMRKLCHDLRTAGFNIYSKLKIDFCERRVLNATIADILTDTGYDGFVIQTLENHVHDSSAEEEKIVECELLAELNENLLRYEASIKCCKRILKVLKRIDQKRTLFSNLRVAKGSVYSSLARLYWKLDRLEVSIKYEAKAHKFFKIILGEQHIEAAVSAYNLSRYLLLCKRAEEAFAIASQGLDSMQYCLGDSHPYLADMYGLIRDLNTALLRFDCAVDAGGRCARVWKREAGGWSKEYADALKSYGDVLFLTARTNDGTARYHTAIDIYRQKEGISSKNVGKLMCELGQQLQQNDLHTEAEIYFTQSSKILSMNSLTDSKISDGLRSDSFNYKSELRCTNSPCKSQLIIRRHRFCFPFSHDSLVGVLRF